MTYDDIKFKQKLSYLQRLLKLRLSFMRYAVDVSVCCENDSIIITWDTTIGEIDNERSELGKKYLLMQRNRQTIEFPVSHLSKRIEHYKRKFRIEFRDRHKK